MRSGVTTLACPPHFCLVAIVPSTSGVMFSGIAGWTRKRITPLRSRRFPALDCDLPEILVERQQNLALHFRQIQELGVARARKVHPHPSHPRAVPSDREQVRLVLVSEVAGVGQARKDVIMRRPGIVGGDHDLRALAQRTRDRHPLRPVTAIRAGGTRPP